MSVRLVHVLVTELLGSRAARFDSSAVVPFSDFLLPDGAPWDLQLGRLELRALRLRPQPQRCGSKLKEMTPARRDRLACQPKLASVQRRLVTRAGTDEMYGEVPIVGEVPRAA